MTPVLWSLNYQPIPSETALMVIYSLNLATLRPASVKEEFKTGT